MGGYEEDDLDNAKPWIPNRFETKCQRKEQFSFAYVRAVGATAGFGVSEPNVNDDSIDGQVPPFRSFATPVGQDARSRSKGLRKRPVLKEQIL